MSDQNNTERLGDEASDDFARRARRQEEAEEQRERIARQFGVDPDLVSAEERLDSSETRLRLSREGESRAADNLRRDFAAEADLVDTEDIEADVDGESLDQDVRLTEDGQQRVSDRLRQDFSAQADFVEPEDVDAQIDRETFDQDVSISEERQDNVATRAAEDIASDDEFVRQDDLDVEVGERGIEEISIPEERRSDIASRVRTDIAADSEFVERDDVDVDVGERGIEDIAVDEELAEQRAEERREGAEQDAREQLAQDIREDLREPYELEEVEVEGSENLPDRTVKIIRGGGDIPDDAPEVSTDEIVVDDGEARVSSDLRRELAKFDVESDLSVDVDVSTRDFELIDDETIQPTDDLRERIVEAQIDDQLGEGPATTLDEQEIIEDNPIPIRRQAAPVFGDRFISAAEGALTDSVFEDVDIELQANVDAESGEAVLADGVTRNFLDAQVRLTGFRNQFQAEFTADQLDEAGFETERFNDRVAVDVSDQVDTRFGIAERDETQEVVSRIATEQFDSSIQTLDIGQEDVEQRDGTFALGDDIVDQIDVGRGDIDIEDEDDALTDAGRAAFARRQLDGLDRGSDIVIDPTLPTDSAATANVVAGISQQIESGRIEDTDALTASDAIDDGGAEARRTPTSDIIAGFDPEDAGLFAGFDSDDLRQAQDDIQAAERRVSEDPAAQLEAITDDPDRFVEQSTLIPTAINMGRKRRSQVRQQTREAVKELADDIDGIDAEDLDARGDPATGEIEDISLEESGVESIQDRVAEGQEFVEPDAVDPEFRDGQLRTEIDETAVQENIRADAAQRLDERVDREITPGDVTLDDGSAELNESIQQRIAADQISNQLGRDVGVDEIDLVDDEFVFEGEVPQQDRVNQFDDPFGFGGFDPVEQQREVDDSDRLLDGVRRDLDNLSDRVRPAARDLGSSLGAGVATMSLAPAIEDAGRSLLGDDSDPVSGDLIEAGVEEATVTAADLPGFASDTIGAVDVTGDILGARQTAVSPFGGPGLGVTIPDPELATEQAESDDIVLTDPEADLAESAGGAVFSFSESLRDSPGETSARAIGAIAGGVVGGFGLARGGRGAARAGREIDLDIDGFVRSDRAQLQTGRQRQEIELEDVDRPLVEPDDIADQQLISSVDPRRTAREVGQERAFERNIELDPPDRSFSTAPDAEDIRSVSRQQDIRTVDRGADRGPTSPVADGPSFRGLDTDLSPLESQLAAQQGQRAAQADLRAVTEFGDSSAAAGRRTLSVADQLGLGVGAVAATDIDAGTVDDDLGLAGGIDGVGEGLTATTEVESGVVTGSPTLTGVETPVTGQTLLEVDESLLDGDVVTTPTVDSEIDVGVLSEPAVESDASVGDLGASRPVSGVGSDIDAGVGSDVAAGVDSDIIGDMATAQEPAVDVDLGVAPPARPEPAQTTVSTPTGSVPRTPTSNRVITTQPPRPPARTPTRLPPPEPPDLDDSERDSDERDIVGIDDAIIEFDIPEFSDIGAGR